MRQSLVNLFKENIYVVTLRRIYHVLSPRERVRAGFIMITTFLSALLDVLGIAFILPVIYLINDTTKIHTNPYLNTIYQYFQFNDERTFLLFSVTILVLAFVAKGLLGMYLVYLQEEYTSHLGIAITNREFKKYLNKSYVFVLNNNTSKTIQAVTRIPIEFTRVVVSSMLILTTEYVVILLILIGIIAYNYIVFFLLLSTVLPVVLMLNKITQKRVHDLGQERNNTQDATFKLIIEALQAYVEVKLTTNEKYFIERAKQPLEAYANTMAKLKVFQSTPLRIVETASVLGIAVLYVYVAYFSGNPSQMVFTLVLFASASYRILPSVNKILTSMMAIRGNSFVFDTMSTYEDYESINAPVNKKLSFNKTIELKGISYKYPGKEIKALDNVSFTINKGDAIGLIGESGSGKSTLGKLLLRLLIEKEGHIEVDNQILSEEYKADWYSKLGYVQQDFYLLDGSLAENIAFGVNKDQIDYVKMHDIIKRVKLDQLVSTFPNGLEYTLGEFGARLSGGQRQRIAIARALYKNASILIFDEATSALDNETEEEIMNTLYELCDHKLTLIVIAHRITTLKKCDIIYELVGGKVANSYSYEELTRKIIEKPSIA